MRGLPVLCMLVVILAGLVGCARTTPEPAVELPPTATAVPTPTIATETDQSELITVWYHSGLSDARLVVEEAAQAFTEQQDDYRVEVALLPEGDYTEQVKTAALAGELPCLLDFDGPLLYNFAWAGYLRPIDPFVSEEMVADVLPSIIDQGTYQGALYSLGQFDSGLALHANQRHLEAAGARIPTFDEPWDLAEFEETLQKLTDLPDVEYALDMKIDYGRGEFYTYAFSPILQSFGGDLIDRRDYQSAGGILDGPESVEAMSHFQSWFENGWVNDEPEGDEFYDEQNVGLVWVGHWMYNQHQEALGDDLLMLPMPDFGNGPKTGMGSWNWGISSSCSTPEGAGAFLEYMMSPEQIVLMNEATGAVPALQSVLAESELYGPDGPLHIYVQQLASEVAVPRPKTPAYAAITEAFAQAVENIIAGADVQEELSRAAQKIDRDIEDHDGYSFQ